MALNFLEILDDFGTQIVEQLQSNIPKASGRTAKSIEVETKTQGNKTIMEVTGPSYIFELEFGRGPTKGSGTGQVRKSIRQWIDDKGIIPKEDITEDQLSWAIATKIHKEGFKGTPGIITGAITDQQIVNVEKGVLEDLARASVRLFENFQVELKSVS